MECSIPSDSLLKNILQLVCSIIFLTLSPFFPIIRATIFSGTDMLTQGPDFLGGDLGLGSAGLGFRKVLNISKTASVLLSKFPSITRDLSFSVIFRETLAFRSNCSRKCSFSFPSEEGGIRSLMWRYSKLLYRASTIFSTALGIADWISSAPPEIFCLELTTNPELDSVSTLNSDFIDLANWLLGLWRVLIASYDRRKLRKNISLWWSGLESKFAHSFISVRIISTADSTPALRPWMSICCWRLWSRL